MSNQESRHFDVFGPKLIIETGNPQMGMPGRDAFKMMSTTDQGIRFVQSHTESGMSKYMTEGSLQVEVGDSSLVNNDQTTFQFITHKGDFAVNADAGHIKIYGKAITIEASEQLVLQSPKIQLGYEQEFKTKDIKIMGQSVDLKSIRGGLADVLGTSSLLKTFLGTPILDKVLQISGNPVASTVTGLVKGASNLLGIKFI